MVRFRAFDVEEEGPAEECSPRTRKMSLLVMGLMVLFGRVRCRMSMMPGEKCWIWRVEVVEW